MKKYEDMKVNNKESLKILDFCIPMMNHAHQIKYQILT